MNLPIVEVPVKVSVICVTEVLVKMPLVGVIGELPLAPVPEIGGTLVGVIGELPLAPIPEIEGISSVQGVAVALGEVAPVKETALPVVAP